jgi:hypothetical protein
MNKGGEQDSHYYIRKAAIAASKEGDFSTLSPLLDLIENHQSSKIAKTDGLFCTECHKPAKGN